MTANSKAVAILMSAILDAIEAGGEQGAPSGVLYAGLMSMGMTYNAYQTTIDSLKDAGYLTVSNHLLRLTDHGAKMAGKLRTIKAA